jgi:hypothetical protein
MLSPETIEKVTSIGQQQSPIHQQLCKEQGIAAGCHQQTDTGNQRMANNHRNRGRRRHLTRQIMIRFWSRVSKMLLQSPHQSSCCPEPVPMTRVSIASRENNSLKTSRFSVIAIQSAPQFNQHLVDNDRRSHPRNNR